MSVPFIDLKPLVRLVREDALRDFGECLEACELVGGVRVDRLEGQIAGALGAKHAAACASGTDALTIGLRVLGIGPGMKVALPNLTFFATYEAIVQVGAEPVLVDVDPDDLQLSLTELARAHEAIGLDGAVFVHLFGWTSPRLGELRAFCEERGITLLEDAAQAFGVTIGGRPVLEGARAAAVSFYPAKVIGGAMDGGALLLRDAADAELARSLRNHGRRAHYSHAHVGWSSRMSAMQAAYLSRVLAHADRIVGARREAARRYRDRLSRVPAIRLWSPPSGVEDNGYLLVASVDGIAGAVVHEALRARGVGAARTYPETIDQQLPARTARRCGALDASRDFTRAVVNLPLFYGITDEQIDAAASALESIARAREGAPS